MTIEMKTIERMKEIGGLFEKSLADCWLTADELNRSKLTSMFPEFEKFKENWNLADNIIYTYEYNETFLKSDVKKCKDLILNDCEEYIRTHNTNHVREIMNIIKNRFGNL